MAAERWLETLTDLSVQGDHLGVLARCRDRLDALDRAGLALAARALNKRSPLRHVRRAGEQLHQQQQALRSVMERRLAGGRQSLHRQRQLLESLNPLAVLERGYAILSDAEGKVVRAAESVAPGDALRARLAHGEIAVTVTGRRGRTWKVASEE